MKIRKKIYRFWTKIMMNINPSKAAKMMGVDIRGGENVKKHSLWNRAVVDYN